MSFSKKAICIGISLALLSSTVLANSNFHNSWKTVKEKAKKDFVTACDKAKSDKKHKESCDFVSFKGDFGPDLDKLDKAFSAFEKTRNEKSKTEALTLLSKIKATATNYEAAVKQHKTAWTGKVSGDHWSAVIDELQIVKNAVLPNFEGQIEKLSKIEVIHIDISSAVKSGILKAEIDKIASALPADYSINFFVEGPATLFEKNPVWHAELVDAVTKTIQEQGATFKSALEAINQKVANNGYSDLKVATTEIKKAYTDFEAAISPAAKTAMDNVWKKIVSDKKEYRIYQVKSGLSIAAKSIGLITSIATTAAGGFTGAGTVIGAIGMVKTTIQLFNETRDLLKDAETVGKTLDKDIASMREKLNAQSPTATGVKELGKAGLDRLTGIRITGLKSIDDNFTLYQNKLKGYHTKASSLGGKINQALSETQALSKKVALLKKEAAEKKIPQLSTTANKLEATVSKLEKQLDNLLKAASSAMEGYNKGMENVKNLTTTINDLREKQPTWSENLQKYVIPLLDFAYINPDSVADIIDTTVSTSLSVIVELTTTATETENAIKGVAANQGLEAALGGKDVIRAILEAMKSE